MPVIATDQVGSADDLIEPGVNGLVVPAGSSHALAEAMRELGRVTPEQRKRCAEKCQTLLAARTLDDAAEAWVMACTVGLEHRHRSRKRLTLLSTLA